MAASLAALSAMALRGSPPTWCAGTYTNSTSRPVSSASIRWMISRFATGFPAAVFQPLRFQAGSHLPTASRA
jgi:hypothetical protein